MTAYTGRLTPTDVVEQFIAAEVGWHSDGMRVQATDLICSLNSHGYDIVADDEAARWADDCGFLLICAQYGVKSKADALRVAEIERRLREQRPERVPS